MLKIVIKGVINHYVIIYCSEWLKEITSKGRVQDTNRYFKIVLLLKHSTTTLGLLSAEL